MDILIAAVGALVFALGTYGALEQQRLFARRLHWTVATACALPAAAASLKGWSALLHAPVNVYAWLTGLMLMLTLAPFLPLLRRARPPVRA